MKTLNILIFLLVFNTFILLGYLASEMTGEVTYERMSVNLTRVIDGDTIVYEIGNITQHVRLLGINTPEKKQPYYEEARDFLKQYGGREVAIEERGKDKYDRTLGYIFYNEEMLNKLILKQGLASLYVYDKDEYYSGLEKAEEEARDAGIGLWKKSNNYGCIKIIDFNPIDKNKDENETLILQNECGISLKIIIKDDANHIYNEQIGANSKFERQFKDIFNDDGDSLYVRDDSGLLVFYRYP